MEGTAALVPDLPPVTPAFIQAPAAGGSGRAETAAALAKAERHLQNHRYAEAVEALGETHIPTTSAPDLALRVLHCETRARLYLGDARIDVAA